MSLIFSPHARRVAVGELDAGGAISQAAADAVLQSFDVAQKPEDPEKWASAHARYSSGPREP